jgi:hypothetical protein
MPPFESLFSQLFASRQLETFAESVSIFTFIMCLLCTRKVTSRISSSGRRFISVGTDLTTTCQQTWQEARPWHMSSEEGSNKAVDNAMTMSSVFQGKTVAVFGVPAPFTGK